jgi:hypothetical protein
VHLARQLLSEREIDHALAGDLGEADERFRLDQQVEMAFAAFSGAGVTMMACGVIDDLKPVWAERVD